MFAVPWWRRQRIVCIIRLSVYNIITVLQFLLQVYCLWFKERKKTVKLRVSYYPRTNLRISHKYTFFRPPVFHFLTRVISLISKITYLPMHNTVDGYLKFNERPVLLWLIVWISRNNDLIFDASWLYKINNYYVC